MLSIDQPVRLDKLSAHNSSEGMLPTGYWNKGRLLELPTVGQTLRLARFARAAKTPDEIEPVEVFGIYVSSPVVSITEREDGSVDCFTQNSVWRVTQLEDSSHSLAASE